MFNNPSKMIFYFMLMFSTMITISANSWFGVWMGLEINLLSFIPLMTNNNNMMSSEASIKYFIIQVLASSIMLFSMITFMLFNNFSFQMMNKSIIISFIIMLTLMLKMGAAPFHFWLPNVMEGLNWKNNLLLLIWQKIAPMMILSYLNLNKLLMIFIIMSIFFGSIGGLNQTSLRKIMAYSSINHMGWMLATLMFNEILWKFYFFFYSMLTFTMILFLNFMKIFYLNQLYFIFFNSNLMKIFFFMNLLSLGGLPPFIGFLPKWMVIQSLSFYNQYFLLLVVICLTLITLYYYLRLSFSAFMMNYSSLNWNNFFFYKNKLVIISSVMVFFSIFGLIMSLEFMNFS